MIKEFLPYEKVRNNALKLAHKIYKEDNFVPDVLYCSLRGGAYMANVGIPAHIHGAYYNEIVLLDKLKN